jgi:DNA repair exonuclease SbcCD ATPase subunit
MELDLKAIKDKIGQSMAELRTRYNEKIDEGYVFKTIQRVNEGIATVVEVQGLVEKVNSKIDYTRQITSGVTALIKNDPASEDTNERSLEVLTDVYYSKHSPISKFFMKLVGRKEVTISQGLDVLKDTVSVLPSYVNKLNEQLGKSETDMYNLKKELRGSIETIIAEKPELCANKEALAAQIKDIEDAYKQYERVRNENSSKGVSTEHAVLEKLEELELVLNHANDYKREIDTKEKTAQKNVDLLNAQIKKVDQYLSLLGSTREVVTDANNYVNVQVPYVLEEIKSQKSGIQAITGVNSVLNFLENQQQLSLQLNQRIKVATAYLGAKVEEVRLEAIQAHSIYPMLEQPKAKGALNAPKVIDVEVVKRQG